MPRSSKVFLLSVVSAAALLTSTACTRTPEERYARAIEKGKKFLAAKDYSRATVEFQNAVQAKPRNPEPLVLLGESYLNQFMLPTAISYFRKATELDPNYAPAQLRMADLMLRTHNDQLSKEAESRIQKVLTGNPGDDDALLALAGVRVQLGKVEDAEKYLNEVLRRSPTNLKSAIALAQVKLNQRDFKAAEQILKQSVEGSPKSADAATALGTYYAGVGQLPEGEGMFRKAVQLDPNNSGALTALGEVQMLMGKPADAEKTYKAVAALPGTTNTLAYAVFLMRQNRRPEAVLELERQNKANPNDRIARTALVAGYLTTDRMEAAESVLNAVLKANGKDQEALIQRSQVYLRKGEYDQAKNDIEAILRFDGSSAQGHYLMAKVYRAQNAPLKQRDELFQALRIAPESLSARFDLADAQLAANDRAAPWRLWTERSGPGGYVAISPGLQLGPDCGRRGRRGAPGCGHRPECCQPPEALLRDSLSNSPTGSSRVRAPHWKGTQRVPGRSSPLDAAGSAYRPRNRYLLPRRESPAVPAAQSPALQMYYARWLLRTARGGRRYGGGRRRGSSPKSSAPPCCGPSESIGPEGSMMAHAELTAVIAKDRATRDAHMSLAMVEDSTNKYDSGHGRVQKSSDPGLRSRGSTRRSRL